MFPLLLSLLAAPAHAVDWSDFADAFPALPCSDGWAACLVGGDPISPEPVKDKVGVPTPSDLRVSWFALESQPAFDPFAGLSVYSGPPTTETVVARVDPPEVQPTDVIERVEMNPNPLDRTPPALSNDDKKPTVSPKDPVEPGCADGDGCGSTEEPDDKPQQGEAEPQPVMAANPTALEDWGDRNEIEGKAMLGKLTEAQRTCLEKVAGSGTAKITARSKASRPLLYDAWTTGDKSRWEQLVVRHLDEIERSDPAIAMNYASHLARQGRSPAAVIRWSDVALENRTVWTSPHYERNTLKLRGLKARAAGREWQSLEEKKAGGQEVDPAKLQRWRTDTVTFAREWFEYSKAVGKPSDQALALCISAAGTEDACR